MSLLCRQAWGRLACLAILAVIVLAACSSGPGVAAPTVRDGAPEAIRFDPGQTTRAVTLSGVFTGENLTFSKPTSSAPAVATASIANGTLIITAVSPGDATIAVTATNARGNVKHEITVTVPEPTTSEPEPGATPTVKADAPDSVEFDQGQTTRTVALSTVFEEQNLEFSETSSDPDVATASITTNGILVIRAGDPGDATITVTATNAAGRSASHEIAVTVPEPEDDGDDGDDSGDQTPQPSATCTFPQTTRLTIERTDDVKCTLPKGYTLSEPPGDVLTLDERPDGETDNVWLIEANKKGTHTITVFNEGRKRAGTITVTVPNTPPRRVSRSHPDVQTLTSPRSTPTASDMDIRLYFTDEDAEDYTTSENSLRYRVQSKPDWVLVESDDEGFVSVDGPGNITLEVLEPMGKEGEERDFPVSIYAVDNSGDESNRPVRIVFDVKTTGIDPRPGEYSAQQLSNGALHRDSTLDVGPRFLRDTGTAVHTLTFSRVEDGPGFTFSANFVKGLIDGKRLGPSGVPAVIANTAIFIYRDRDKNNLPSVPIPTWTSDTPLETDYYLLESSGVVKAKWPTALASAGTISDDPEIEFKLTGRGSGTIRISYHVVALASKSEADPFPNDGGGKTSTPVSTLTLRVVTCESPPNELDRCAGYTE